MPETKLNLPLSEWTVLSLRPRGQHAVAHCEAKLRGAKFLACSSIKLVAIASDADLKKALACKLIIVTSPAAARFAAQSPVFSIMEKTRWFALGKGTSAVLDKKGITQIVTPVEGSDSESLLAIPDLQDIDGKDIGLITAPGGRGMIEPELIGRGANLHVCHVYQRKPVTINARQMRQLEQLPLPFAVLCSSHEVFESFWRQMPAETRTRLNQGLWITSSARLEGLLRDAGIRNTASSESARPADMLAHLIYVQTQQVR